MTSQFEANKVIQGDCLEVMRTLPENSISSFVSDPPAGIAFMGKKWDTDKGGRKQWCAYMEERFAEALRLCKPGAYGLVWALPRTSHWTATALEDAGWEVKDVVTHHFGCLDPSTKAITPKGAVHYQSLEVGNLVLCYDLASKKYSYQPIQETYEYDYEDTAYRIIGDFGEIIVTRSHRCIVERGGRDVCIEAEALQCEEGIPILENLPELRAALAGENARASRQEQVLRKRVRQTSSVNGQDGCFQDPSRCLRSLPNPVSSQIKYTNSRCEVLQREVLRSVQVNGSGYSGANGKYCSSWEQGSKTRNSSKICGAVERGSKPVVERGCDIQKKEGQSRGSTNQVCEVSTGVYSDGEERRVCYGASATSGERTQQGFDKVGSGSPCKSQRGRQPDRKSDVIQDELGSQTIRIGAKHRTALVRVEPFHYSGKVWCIKVPTGFFVAERNGVVFPTGNSGFPKSQNIGKAIEKKSPATPEAKQWDGWGTSLKPASEHWILVRKPIEGTIAGNVLKWRVGGLNIDGCRVGSGDSETRRVRNNKSAIFGSANGPNQGNTQGRFPANLVLSHSHDCDDDRCADGCPVKELDEQTGILKSGGHWIGGASDRYGGYEQRERYYQEADSGGASRYFPRFHYYPKASTSDRSHKGQVQNNHPTVKNRDLMRWLCRLVTPPGGTVLDCFAGSGSTAIACLEEGFNYVLIEQDAESVRTINDRVNVWLKENRPEPTIEERLTWLETKVEAIDKRSKKTAADIGQLSLFEVS